MGPDGLPIAAAFELKPNDDYLSVNWLDYFGDHDIEIERVREAFHRKGYRLRKNGRFAEISVGAAIAAVAEVVGRPGWVEHLPEDDDESHAGLHGYVESDLAVAVELRALIQHEHICPAVSESLTPGR